MKAEINQEKCSSCKHCMDVCAFDAIRVETQWVTTILVDQNKCTGCGVCEQICFEEAIMLS